MSDSGPRREGVPFVVSGPSGAGKSSVLRGVIARLPDVVFSVSHTTRKPRPGERDGSDYWFIDEGRFRSLVAERAFLEWAEYQGNLYGTSAAAISGPANDGRDVILEVEVKGARQLRERLPFGIFVFVLPPSLDVIESRLRSRASEPEDAIRKRLARAREELREVGIYDYVIVNDDLDRTIEEFIQIMRAARLQRHLMVPLLSEQFDFGSGGSEVS